MVQFADFTDEEQEVVTAIARRATMSGLYDDPVAVMMDISATHVHCPLRLNDLLNADDFNFGHDIGGIERHLNRSTGWLKNFFLPRFAQPQQ